MIQLKLANNIKEAKQEINKHDELKVKILKKVIFKVWLKIILRIYVNLNDC